METTISKLVGRPLLRSTSLLTPCNLRRMISHLGLQEGHK